MVVQGGYHALHGSAGRWRVIRSQRKIERRSTRMGQKPIVVFVKTYPVVHLVITLTLDLATLDKRRSRSETPHMLEHVYFVSVNYADSGTEARVNFLGSEDDQLSVASSSCALASPRYAPVVEMPRACAYSRSSCVNAES